jgi:hypothetical protein
MPSTYEPLISLTTTSNVSQVTLSNIPQNYNDLVLVATGQAAATGADIYVVTLDGDNNSTGNLYSVVAITGNGSGASTYRAANQSGFVLGNLPAPSATDPAPSFFHFNNYSNNTTFKNVILRTNVTTGGGLGSDIAGGTWRNTSAINTITLRTVNGYGIKAGSTFNLYALTANNLKATGGDIITTDGVYWYHAFTKSGTFTPQTALTCDYLVVAGGGGGGGNNAGSGGSGAGGGGAGGLRSTITATGGGGSLESALSLSANVSYTVAIGSGGSGGISNVSVVGQTGTNGSNTTFSTITSIGGGGGGGQDLIGSNGGSGGGGGSNDKAAGTGTANQGYAGGRSGNGSTAYRAGGGGGAGAVGTSGVSVAPVGGNGVSISQLASITGTGVSNFYAGGGGGGSYNGLPGIGGAGGGGAGSQQGDGGFAAPNTGSGGGGAGYNGYTFGGNGGSGIVIVRYAV